MAVSTEIMLDVSNISVKDDALEGYETSQSIQARQEHQALQSARLCLWQNNASTLYDRVQQNASMAAVVNDETQSGQGQTAVVTDDTAQRSEQH